jgi:hypothetical protein
MDILTLFSHAPLSMWIAIVSSVVIPGLSAALVKEHWDSSITGILTVGLSTADGFFAEWAKDGSNFNWRIGVGIAIGSWFIAAISQSKILSGTQFESWLLSLGSRLKFDLADQSSRDDQPVDPTLSLPAELQRPEDQVPVIESVPPTPITTIPPSQ